MERAAEELSGGDATAGRSPLSGRAVLRTAVVLLRHPRLWWTAAVQALTLARPGWWRRWPPVPTPDRAYLRFRMQTMYGDPAHEPAPADVVTYLDWCRESRRAPR